MAIGLYFRPVSMNAQQYDEIMSRLDAAGAGRPAGRSYHVCFGDGDKLAVYDVWDSMDQFEAFGATLMPILAAMQVDPGQPMPEPVHNVIKG